MIQTNISSNSTIIKENYWFSSILILYAINTFLISSIYFIHHLKRCWWVAKHHKSERENQKASLPHHAHKTNADLPPARLKDPQRLTIPVMWRPSKIPKHTIQCFATWNKELTTMNIVSPECHASRRKLTWIETKITHRSSMQFVKVVSLVKWAVFRKLFFIQLQNWRSWWRFRASPCLHFWLWPPFEPLYELEQR